MTSTIVNAAHLAAGAAGFAAIVFANRSPLFTPEKFGKAFWPLVALGSALTAAALFYITEPVNLFEDFRHAYWEAGAAAWGPREAFEAVYARGTDGFVNIPIIAYLFAPFGLLPDKIAAFVFFALGIVAAIISWLQMTKLFSLDRRDSALCLFAIACFGPLIYSLREGNISHLMLPLLLAALQAHRDEKGVRAGLLFGLAAILKPPLILIGAYFFLRQQWRVVAGGAAAMAGLAVLSLAVFGLDMHLLWYRNCIAPFAIGPVPGFNVQSIPAAISRLELGPLSFVDWDAHPLSPLGRIVALASGAALVIASVWACLARGWRSAPGAQERELEVMIVLTLACVISTLSWSHYYVWLLPAFVLAYQYTKAGESAAAWRPTLIAAYALSMPAEFFSWQMRSGAFGATAHVLTAHLTIGGLILLAVLLRIRAAKPA